MESRQAMPRPEYWTEEQVADYLGIKPGSVPSWCFRNNVTRQLMARADDVRKAKAEMPGQGRKRARTDLARTEERGQEARHKPTNRRQTP